MVRPPLYFRSMADPAASRSRDLIDLVAARALKRGTFTLASGRVASFYLDAKQVVLDSHGAMLVGRAILDRLEAAGPLPGRRRRSNRRRI